MSTRGRLEIFAFLSHFLNFLVSLNDTSLKLEFFKRKSLNCLTELFRVINGALDVCRVNHGIVFCRQLLN